MKNFYTVLVLALVATVGVFFLFSNDSSSGDVQGPSADSANPHPQVDSGPISESVETIVSVVDQASALSSNSRGNIEPEPTDSANEIMGVVEPSSPFESLRSVLSDFSNAGGLDVDGLLVSLAQGLPDLDSKERAQIMSVVGELIVAHPESTDAVLAGLDSFQDKGMVVRATIKQWMEVEPQVAAEWSMGLQDASLRRLAVNRMSASWAESDLDGVIGWAAGLQDRQDLATALDGITWTWAQKDPEAVFEYASQIEDEHLRNQMFLSTAKMMAYKDPVGTTEWAAQFPAGTKEREQALSYSLFQWANKDVLGAVDFALELEDPKVRDSGLLSVARSWAVKDPAAATEWAESFENEDMKRQAWASSAVQWAQKDPDGLAQWMQGRSVDEIQGHVMRQAVGVIGRSDPQVAQDWIQKLGSPELQQAAQAALFDLQQRQMKQGQ